MGGPQRPPWGNTGSAALWHGLKHPDTHRGSRRAGEAVIATSTLGGHGDGCHGGRWGPHHRVSPGTVTLTAAPEGPGRPLSPGSPRGPWGGTRDRLGQEEASTRASVSPFATPKTHHGAGGAVLARGAGFTLQGRAERVSPTRPDAMGMVTHQPQHHGDGHTPALMSWGWSPTNTDTMGMVTHQPRLHGDGHTPAMMQWEWSPTSPDAMGMVTHQA